MDKKNESEIERDEVVAVLLDLLGSWRDFKKGHDLKSAKISCCDVTTKLWLSLQNFENMIQRRMYLK